MKIIGRFYLKRTSNGNLLGEWSNQNDTKAYSESADLTNPPGQGGFLGTYDSTWYEGGTPIHAKLVIQTKTNAPSLFTLTWSGNSNFEGEGMLCDDILVGDYHSVP